jgi:hypothetical protein
LTVRVGERLIGVRTNDERVADHLRAVLAASVVPDVDAPPNLSLKLGDDTARIRDLDVLYHGATPAVKTRSRRRLLRATRTFLDAFADPPGTLRLNARLLASNGTAVLVDDWLREVLERVERRIERFGYRVVDVAGVPIEPETLAVELRPPRLAVDRDAWAAVERDYPGDDGHEPSAARLTVGHVVMWNRQRDTDQSGAQRLAALLPLLALHGREPQGPDLELARRVYYQWDVRSCPAEDAALLAQLRELSGA